MRKKKEQENSALSTVLLQEHKNEKELRIAPYLGCRKLIDEEELKDHKNANLPCLSCLLDSRR
jgi:hypothetical protein